MKKVLIYTDTHKQSDFENNIEATTADANALIELYHNFQPWILIKTLPEFHELISDPIKAMDQVLIKNSGISLEMSGGKLPNPAMVAKLLDLDYDNFINAVKGLKIIEGSCKPCNKLTVKQTGQGVLSYATFKKYQEYLLFDEGLHRFTILEDAVSNMKETFQVYAETDKQIECYNFWHNACDTLNELSKRGYLGRLDEFSKLLNGRITFSHMTNKLSLDMQNLLYELQNLKK